MKSECPHCRKTATLHSVDSATPIKSIVLVQCEDIRQCGARTHYALSLKKTLKASLLPKSEQLSHADGLVSDNFRINCPDCGNPAVIYSRYNPTKITSDLYCRCSHADCLAKFVVDFSYQSTALPPAASIEQLAVHIVKNAPPRRLAQFQLDLFGAAF